MASNTFTKIATVTVGSGGASSIDFSSIGSSYTDLKIVLSGRDASSAGGSGAGYSFTILPNGLTTNITQRSLFSNATNASSYNDTAMYNVTDMSADTASTFSNVEIYIPNYTSSNYKSFSIDGVTENNATPAAIRLSAGLWSSTSVISSIKLSAYSSWVQYSTATLYGIKNS